ETDSGWRADPVKFDAGPLDGVCPLDDGGLMVGSPGGVWVRDGSSWSPVSLAAGDKFAAMACSGGVPSVIGFNRWYRCDGFACTQRAGAFGSPVARAAFASPAGMIAVGQQGVIFRTD